MPKASDLAKLAEKIYPTIGSIDAEGKSECPSGNCWQTDVVNSYGFNITAVTFEVWSGEEGDSYGAYGRYFAPAYTEWHGYFRRNSLPLPVCLGD